MTLYTYIKNV